MIILKKKIILSFENYDFWGTQLSSSAQPFRKSFQLSSAQQNFFPAQLAQLSKDFSTAQLSSAQIFFFKICNSGIDKPDIAKKGNFYHLPFF
jgi:hypothetical protein